TLVTVERVPAALTATRRPAIVATPSRENIAPPGSGVESIVGGRGCQRICSTASRSFHIEPTSPGAINAATICAKVSCGVSAWAIVQVQTSMARTRKDRSTRRARGAVSRARKYGDSYGVNCFDDYVS